ncbi:MAG: hypothetical protein ACP5T0_07445 [Verrucomicrobiia bacterium]
MKRTIHFLGLIIALLFITGCLVRSINPLYTEKNLIFDEKLLGEWKVKLDVWKFSKQGNGYLLTQIDNEGKKAEFEVHLLKLGKYRFLDFYLKEFDKDLGKKLNSFGLLHLIPAHSFMRVESIEKDETKLRVFSLDWLKKTVEQNPNIIPHILVHDKDYPDVILTAETSKLQDFVLNNVEDAFDDLEITLERQNDDKK